MQMKRNDKDETAPGRLMIPPDVNDLIKPNKLLRTPLISNWYLEIVTSIFSKGESDEIEQRYDELFPRLHTVCACGFFTIAASVLDGPLTGEQEAFLKERKETGELLDYHARNQVHWAQLRPDTPVRPIMCSCGKRIAKAE